MEYILGTTQIFLFILCFDQSISSIDTAFTQIVSKNVHCKISLNFSDRNKKGSMFFYALALKCNYIGKLSTASEILVAIISLSNELPLRKFSDSMIACK